MSLQTRELAHRPAPRLVKSGPCFPVAADACICSRGCPTTACPRCKQTAGMGLGSWGCKRSSFCDHGGVQGGAAALSASALPRATLLTFLTFRAAHVRNVFAKKPQRAYMREVKRIAHLASTVRRVGSRLPFHCVVAGDRNQTQERYLESVSVQASHSAHSVCTAGPAKANRRLPAAGLGPVIQPCLSLRCLKHTYFSPPGQLHCVNCRLACAS